MTKAEKSTTIELLKDKIGNSQYFYVTDSSTLTVEKINDFRRECFNKDIEVSVVKNTLVKKALEALDNDNYTPLYDILKGPTTLLFTDKASEAAKVLAEFRKTNDRPVLKGAYIDSDVFIGDDQIDVLKKIKSKEDLIGDIVLLLQSPIKNVIGSIQSGGNTITGLLKALEERGE